MMAKTNAQRQADYRAKREAERITEEELRRIIGEAYFCGRDDQAARKPVGTLQTIYERVTDNIVRDTMNAQRQLGVEKFK